MTGATRVLGIDLSAAAKKTFACTLTTDGEALVAEIEGGCDDQRLRKLGVGCKKIGIDAPFGWPIPFVKAVQAHGAAKVWPGRGLVEPAAFRSTLRYRATDRIVAQTRLPLSVSTNHLGVTAMRCAQLLDRWTHKPVERTGRGRFVEVYPAGALVRWQIPATGYKKSRTSRATLLRHIGRQLPALSLNPTARKRCLDSDDAVDALVAALTARAASLRLTTGPPTPELRRAAEQEGWIHMPVRGSLPFLSRPRATTIDPKPAILATFRSAGGKTDRRGYAGTLEAAVMPSFNADTVQAIRADLEHKGGSETKTRRRAPAKFLAPHSSAALAANSFGPFMSTQVPVPLASRRFVGDAHLEAECPTGISRIPPTLDFLVEGGEVLAVESKFTEQFDKHRAQFNPPYAKAIADLHKSWQDEYTRLVEDPTRYQHLKADQLVKHCLGLCRIYGRRRLTFAYLYWEPTNASEVAPCVIHRAEIAEFAQRVADPRIRFVPISYSELWEEWSRKAQPAWLKNHANALKRRYELRIGR